MAAIISGKVFHDANHNGVYDSGEAGIANVYVSLYSSITRSCVSTQTDSEGNYSFSVTQAGSYTVYEPVTNINATCPPTNFTQPPLYTMSNGPRKLSESVTQNQINNNATIGNQNFSHDMIDNPVACTNAFIQFAGNPTSWYDIDVVTGQSTLKTTLSPAQIVNAIGYNGLDNYIYGYDQTTNSIVRVDDAGTIITLKPNPTGLPANTYNTGTFDPNGFLYIFVNDGTRFYTIDLRPNSATFMKLVNPTNGYLEQTSNYGVALNPAVNVSDWVYNPNDQNLYGVTNTGILARIVPTTGATSNLTTIGATNGPFGAQAIDAHGNIYAINNRDGNVYKYTISGNTATGTYFSNTVITSNNDGTICPTVAINVDFGDAPDVDAQTGPYNYNTLLANNGPRHQIRTGLYLGHLITSENDAYQNPTATGDDLVLGIQDDALTLPLTPISPLDTSYSLTVEVTNETGVDANLYGWIDFNQNGIFEELEAATAIVPSGSGLQTANLVFLVPPGITMHSGSTFIRLRLTTDVLTNSQTEVQDDRSVGPASDGEVEDYILGVDIAADVAVTKTALPNPARAGEELTFTIDVTNFGPDTASNIDVVDIVPVELEGVEYSIDGGITWDIWPDSYRIDTLLPSEVRTILIRGVLSSAASGVIQNTVTVTSTTPDPNPDNNTATIDIPIEASADIAVVKVGSPKPVIAGEEITYTITVTNAGPSDALDVTVLDDVAAFLTGAEYSIDGGAIWNLWPGDINIATIVAGEVKQILLRGRVNENLVGNLQNTVTVTSTTPDPDPNNNTDTDDTLVEAFADLTLTKVADRGIVNQGESLTYTIQITNQGPSSATNVQVEDIIPLELPNPEYSIDGGATWNPWNNPYLVGTLASGQIVELLIRGIVAIGATGSIINTATVTSDTPDPNPDNNTDTVVVGISESADVAVTKVGNPDPVNNGEFLTYTIQVMNYGPSIASDVTVTDALPVGLGNPEFSLDGGITWNPWVTPYLLGTLNNGETRQLFVRGVVDRPSNTTIENTVTVTSTTPDPDLSNNTDTTINGVTASADLSVTKIANMDPVIAGNSITYTITVANAGPSDALDVTLIDAVHTDLINPEYSLDGGATWQPWTNSISLGTVGNGASVSVRIRATVAPTTLNTTLKNTAIVTSSTPDPDPSNNIDEIDTTITTEADLAMTKTSSPNPVLAGDRLTYTLTVTNAGPSDAQMVSIIDAIPAGLLNPEFSIDHGISFQPWINPYTINRFTALSSITILIRGIVSPAVTTPITNTAVVTSSTPDPDLSNNTDTNTTVVEASADISIRKTALTNPVQIGDTVIYQLLINNAGANTASSVVLYDLIPTDILNPEISLDGGTTWVPFTNPFPIGDLENGRLIRVLVRGIVADTTRDQLVNHIFAISPTPDPDLSNNADDEVVIIQPVPGTADLEIIKTGPSTAADGGILTYQLRITNLGPNRAENVVVTDLAPSQLQNVQFSLDGGITWNFWTGTATFPSLEADDSILILVRGFVSANLEGVLTNTATVTSDTPDSDPDNNTSTVVTQMIHCRCDKVDHCFWKSSRTKSERIDK